jgi:AraC family transcriptional regulator
MDPVNKALWLVETRLGDGVTVDDVAAASGLSRFHLSRLFSLCVGQSIMRYARGRRLTEAARALSKGAPDILAVALDAGYGSHEAFTRAFRDQFGVTPETVRAQGALDNLELVEPFRMTTVSANTAMQPRIETAPAQTIVGIRQRHAMAGAAAISQQWVRFAQHLGTISGEKPGVTFGVCTNYDDDGGYDYLAGVAVDRIGDLPAGFTTQQIPTRRYAVFTHAGHVATISATFKHAWGEWLPASGETAADAPMFERYDHRFNPMTGAGEMEVWLPLEG